MEKKIEMLAGSGIENQRTTSRILLGMTFIGLLAGSSSVMWASTAAGGSTPSRAALLEAKRLDKKKAVALPERGALEKGLYWYDNQLILQKLTAGWHGVHMAGGGFPAGAGLTFGVGFTDLGIGSVYAEPDSPNRIDFDSRVAYSTSGYLRLRGDLLFHNLGGAPLGGGLHGQYYELPQEDFFGLGADSREENRTSYLLDGIEVGADLSWEPAKGLRLVSGLFYEEPRVGQGTDPRFPSTEKLFDRATLPGFQDEPEFLRLDARVSYDWRDNPLHPHAGGFYSLRVSDYRDGSVGRFDFRRYEVDLHQYVPLPHRHRVLALRSGAILTDTGAGQQVPFYYQPTLGGHQKLRGFREFRFRDRNSLWLTAEYRWEAWWALDSALFVDVGKVAFDRSDLDLSDLDVSYGIGFRFHSNSAFVVRLDLAFSREGFVPLLRFEHVF
ncbi:MAG: BamA/TamA family outer membrane protein [Acidobacteriota bacterium]